MSSTVTSLKLSLHNDDQEGLLRRQQFVNRSLDTENRSETHHKGDTKNQCMFIFPAESLLFYLFHSRLLKLHLISLPFQLLRKLLLWPCELSSHFREVYPVSAISQGHWCLSRARRWPYKALGASLYFLATSGSLFTDERLNYSREKGRVRRVIESQEEMEAQLGRSLLPPSSSTWTQISLRSQEKEFPSERTRGDLIEIQRMWRTEL